MLPSDNNRSYQKVHIIRGGSVDDPGAAPKVSLNAYIPGMVIDYSCEK